MKSKSSNIVSFRKAVLGYYEKNGRSDLPWRQTTDPYKVLVSEVMLQQTQVPRVIEKYKSFTKKFPTIRALARSDLAEVLKEWSGLGYNRRGKYLHDAAKAIVAKHKGIFPKDVADLRQLPGMGPYTASAVRVFAFNLPDILIETNVRTAYFHHFFNDKKAIRDVDLIPIATKAADGQDPRIWHWALMDYGSYLKKSGVRNNALSKHYSKQSKFEGSLRQVRGGILRQLHMSLMTRSELVSAALGRLSKSQEMSSTTRSDLVRLDRALAGLERDGLIEKRKKKWRIA